LLQDVMAAKANLYENYELTILTAILHLSLGAVM